ncbi:MAG: DUF1566 domain-containing protein, partial [bacterium]
MCKRLLMVIAAFLFIASLAYTGTIELPKTGQTTSYATGDDGDLEKGVSWPDPRFTIGGNGTVTDNLTGLMWTRNANLAGARTWQGALDYVAGMNTGANPNYGYTDWRLPNRKELRSLIDYSKFNPALPSGHPFINVSSGVYWSSSSYAPNTGLAWIVPMYSGYFYAYYKSGSLYVWPVRSGRLLGYLNILSPEKGPVGTTITIEGMDFSTNTLVSIAFGTTLTITTTLSSPNGTFSTTFIIDTQPSGTKIITARTETLQATTTFVILPTGFAWTNRGNNRGCPGDVMSIQGIGFRDSGGVFIDFGTYRTITSANLIPSGSFLAFFTIPALPRGTYTITIYGSIVTQSFYISGSTGISDPPSGEGPVGTIVYIKGAGYSTETLISIDFGTHPTITTTISDANGSFTTSFIVDTQPGG